MASIDEQEVLNAPTNQLASRVLKGSGVLAEIVKSERTGGWDLLLDGIPNSNVDLWSPSNLHFTYAKTMEGVIDYCYPEGNALKVLHLGAGAMSIARFIDATRPGSAQTVVEIDADLIDFVLEYLPLSLGFRPEILIGDARVVVDQIAAERSGSYDLVVLDIYSGKIELTNLESYEFYESLSGLLCSNGLLLINVVDGPGRLDGSGPRDFSGSQLLTVKEALGDAVLCINEEDYELNGWANMVLVGAGTDRGLQALEIPDGNRAPSVLIKGLLAESWVSSAKIMTDAGIN